MTMPDPDQVLDQMLAAGQREWARAVLHQSFSTVHELGRREGLQQAAERLRLWSSTLEAVADPPERQP